jgi:hypothetical protein
MPRSDTASGVVSRKWGLEPRGAQQVEGRDEPFLLVDEVRLQQGGQAVQLGSHALRLGRMRIRLCPKTAEQLLQPAQDPGHQVVVARLAAGS